MNGIRPYGIVLAALSLVATAVLAGCTESGGGPAPCTGTCDVKMQSSLFNPKDVKVKVGSTVQWTNSDSFNHDVTAKDKSWQSDGGDGGVDAGAKWSKKFDQVGTFDYYCTLHSEGTSGMVGKVTVVA